MTSRFERYRFRDGVTPLSAGILNPIFIDLDMRLVQVEQFRAEYEEASQDAVEKGLERIDAVIVPMIEQLDATIAQAQADLSVLISQTSEQMAQELVEAQAQLDAMLGQAQDLVNQIEQEIERIITQNGLEDRLRFVTRPMSMIVTYDGGLVSHVEETLYQLRAVEGEEVVRGSGSTDILSHTDVQAIFKVTRMETEYIKDTDWQKNGDSVEWLSGGNAPAESETYEVDYSYTRELQRISDISYNGNGNAETIAVLVDGVTRTENYTYNPEGNLTGMTAEEITS